MEVMKNALFFILILLSGCSGPGTKHHGELYDYDVEARLKELGIELQDPKLPKGLNISLSVESGNLLYLSGNGPLLTDGKK